MKDFRKAFNYSIINLLISGGRADSDGGAGDGAGPAGGVHMRFLFFYFRNLYIIKAFDQAPFSTFIMLLIINLDLVLGFPGVHPDGEGGAGG